MAIKIGGIDFTATIESIGRAPKVSENRVRLNELTMRPMSLSAPGALSASRV